MRPLPKGLSVNAKLAKFIVKNAIGLAFTAAIGYTIKVERKVEERIDEHFDAK